MEIFKGLRRPPKMEKEEYLAKLLEKGLVGAAVVPDPVPLAPPIGYKKQPSMVELIRDMVRGERLAAEALASGHETFEDAEDFEVGDEPDYPQAPYGNDFDPPLKELLKAGDAAVKDKAQKDAEKKQPAPRGSKSEKRPAAGGEAPKPGPEDPEDSAA